MSITIQGWHLLAAITCIAWTVLFFWPSKPATGYAGMFDGLMAVLFAAGLLIATLSAWLVYFIVV